MRLCVNDTSTIKNSTLCDYVETADCDPSCYDSSDQTSCNCRNKDFPSKWGKPTCKGISELYIQIDRIKLLKQ